MFGYTQDEPIIRNIFLYGTALELVLTYITNTSDELTVEGFLEGMESE